MKTFLLRLFTWWNGQTFGTQWWTWLYGEFVGEDEFGNRYYRTKGGKIDPTLGFERRWVIYQRRRRSLDGAAELAWLAASHGGCAADAGQRENLPWEKPHRPNLTGTPARIARADRRWRRAAGPKATGDYKAWTPGSQ